MHGTGGYGGSGFGIENLRIGGDPPVSPRVLTRQHDLIVVLDIPDHGYIDGHYQRQIEQMATAEKLVHKLGAGFCNGSGDEAKMFNIDPWTPGERAGPSAYPGGDVVSYLWASAWVKGETAGWFRPLKLPRHIPTWLQISGVTWFFGKTRRYQTNLVWNIRNGLKPNWAALQEYEQLAKKMSSSLESLVKA